MRRGHPNVGGWRGDNQRHFRPRGSGTPHFRPSRPFGLLDVPRYPPPGPRQYRGPGGYGTHPGRSENDLQSEHHDRNKYRINNLHRSQDRGYHNRDRQIPPYNQRRLNDKDHEESYDEPNFYKNPNQCHINTMGDIDHRRQHPVMPWAVPPVFDNNKQYYDDYRSPHKTPRHYNNMEDELPDYSGHRPPASDHYNTTTGPNNNNSQYSHSVDDTVDIIRKRLQNRNKQQDSESSIEHETKLDEDLRKNPNESFPNVSQEQPVKKRIPRQKHNIKSNCDKMKNKIVHQLFKMDKVKIHKLMDDPSSSTKFEYAISSLITEGQNSLNRHLRSAAEKSLCSSNTEFIQDDTIYEDTFMKQMQGLLDPQDTVFLEDIKPIVMAELSRVLQLDDYSFEGMQDHGIQTKDIQSHRMQNQDLREYEIQDHGIQTQNIESHGIQDQVLREYEIKDHGIQTQNIESHGIQDQVLREYEIQDHGIQTQNIESHRMQDQDLREYEIQDHGMHDQGMKNHEIQDYEMLSKDDPSNYSYYEEEKISMPYSQKTLHVQDQPTASNYNNIEISTADADGRNFEYDQQSRFESKPLFERRPAKRVNYSEERRSSQNRPESQQSRQSIDIAFGHTQDRPIRDKSQDCAQPIPLFDPNSNQLSDDDDPFAELDKQYHVAVDHNFIENSSQPPSPPHSYVSNGSKSPSVSRPCSIQIPNNIDISINIKKEIDAQLQNIASSPVKLFNFGESRNATECRTNPKTDIEVKKETVQCLEKENFSSSTEHVKICVEETISHKQSSKRGENKKDEDKIGNVENTTTKSVLQSNTRKRSTDQKPSHRKEKRKRSSNSECHESAKSILNMFYANDGSSKETSKVSKRANSTDKAYSDKYVKRKEPHKKISKYSESSKTDESKRLSSSSNHSNLSPKDSQNNETSSKLDKLKIKSVDLCDNHSNENLPKPDKVKLKPINMFTGQPKKGNSHQQALRNTASASQTVAHSPDDSKPKPVILTGPTFARKLAKRHIGTQVLLKFRSKECQTDKPKQNFKHTQTSPVSINTKKSIATNPLERMKEIDMEIQLLLQEKFKLYNSLETKSAEVPMNTIPSLSMRVFNVNTETTEEKSNDSEDAIVSDFTSIPTEELEQIAMETIGIEDGPDKIDKKSRRRKISELARKNSASPTTKRRYKKVKSPSISLIEQIITDDRPIEDIISLDELEDAPSRTKKKQSRPLPKKKTSKKSKASKTVAQTISYEIKECSVVLERIDIDRYIRAKSEGPFEDAPGFTFEIPIEELQTAENDLILKSEGIVTEVLSEEVCKDFQKGGPSFIQIDTQEAGPSIVDDDEDVNDLQFDMLDVSEDIIIGDCERAGDKVNERETITEEIILDNSQSSIDDAQSAAGAESEVKMYDYSTNESLRRDAITVSGNADAVLAIECIDNDFIAACLDGNVYHFNGDGQLVNTLRGTNQAVTCLTIVKEKYGTTVYTGSLDSRIRYYDLETGMEKGPECNVLSPIQTMDRAWDTVFVGTRTGFVLQFECKNNMLIPVSTVKFSEQSILALRAMKEGPRKVLLVAARSENVVTIKDAQTGLLLRTLQGPKMSVYTLLFEDGKVYCGTASQNVHVFDYTSGSHVGCHEGGKGAVCLRASGGLLFAGCYDGCVYVFRDGEARPLAQLRGPSLMLLSLAIRGTKIIAGYKDKGLYIWKLPLAIVKEMIL